MCRTLLTGTLDTEVLLIQFIDHVTIKALICVSKDVYTGLSQLELIQAVRVNVSKTKFCENVCLWIADNTNESVLNWLMRNQSYTIRSPLWVGQNLGQSFQLAARNGCLQLINFILQIAYKETKDQQHSQLNTAYLSSVLTSLGVQSPQPNLTQADIDTAFQVSCGHGHVDIVRLLFLYEPQPSCHTFALKWAIKNRHVQVVSVLLEYKISITGDDGTLIMSCLDNDDMMKTLIMRGANIGKANGNLLYTLVSTNNGMMVEWLLQRDPYHVSIVNYCLNLAASRGYDKCVSALISVGASVDNENGVSLRSSCANGHFSTVKLLVGADCSPTTLRGGIHAATRNNQNEILAYLKAI